MQDKNFKKTINILKNLVFFPFLILIILSSIFMYSAKMSGQVPSLFGHSIVKILTGSMQPDFKINQTVVVKQTNINTLKVGDVIAFYDYQQPDITAEQLNSFVVENPPTINNNTQISLGNFLGSGISNNYQKQVAGKTKVVFHKITKIAIVDDNNSKYNGKRFFYTSGITQNSTKAWIIEDLVVGRYQDIGTIPTFLLTILTSQTGSLLLIIIPAVIILALIIIHFVKNIKNILNEQEQDKK